MEGIGTRYGYIDSNGNFSGKMPKNEIITITISDYCGNVLFTGDYGPFTDDTDIGTITVAGITESVISGRLINCTGGAVTNGYAFIETGNFGFNSNVNDLGEFETALFLCESVDATVKGYDLDEFLTSDPVSVTTGGSIDVGDIEVCEDIVQFIKITVDDPANETVLFEWLYSGFNGATGNDNYFFGSEGQDSTFINVNLELVPDETGIVNVVSADYFGLNGTPNGIFASCNGGCNGATADITINDSVEGRVKGTTELTLSVDGPDPEIVILVEWDITED